MVKMVSDYWFLREACPCNRPLLCSLDGNGTTIRLFWSGRGGRGPGWANPSLKSAQGPMTVQLGWCLVFSEPLQCTFCRFFVVDLIRNGGLVCHYVWWLYFNHALAVEEITCLQSSMNPKCPGHVAIKRPQTIHPLLLCFTIHVNCYCWFNVWEFPQTLYWPLWPNMWSYVLWSNEPRIEMVHLVMWFCHHSINERCWSSENAAHKPYWWDGFFFSNSTVKEPRNEKC